jgi:ribosomal protein S18 acetylase RimI-like enzyme
MKVRAKGEPDYTQMLEVAKSLPEWFTPKAIRKMEKDFVNHLGLVATHEDRVIGFLTHTVNQHSAEITWMGILPEFQRKGIWKKLLDMLEDELRESGIRKIEVITLHDSVDYPPYEITRNFYRKHGFKNFRILKGYDESGGDGILLVKVIDYQENILKGR